MSPLLSYYYLLCPLRRTLSYLLGDDEPSTFLIVPTLPPQMDVKLPTWGQ